MTNEVGLPKLWPKLASSGTGSEVSPSQIVLMFIKGVGLILDIAPNPSARLGQAGRLEPLGDLKNGIDGGDP